MTSLPFSTPRPEPSVVQAPAAGTGDPLRALLANVVDYAGLFPPAALDMPSAVRAYRRYRTGDHAWMLGAFVAPASRLEELGAAVAEQGERAPWPVSVIVSSPDDGARLATHAHLDVRALEIAPRDAAPLRAPVADRDIDVFFEVPLDAAMDHRLDAVARAGAAAKVRTGGVRKDAFPSAELLARFVAGCAERGVAFKATAGLHHPVRGRYPLTYEPAAATCEMFGFLELALVAALLRARRVGTEEAAVLLQGGPGVEIDGDALLWAGHHVSGDEITELRRSLFRSFGSCSFEEPVADLAGMGLL
ncbi:MAG: hypothetical protein AB7T31_12345 [Gemmatimonadales bacterium]